MPAHRLITMPISHFCEKARWALQRAGVAHVEERHVQPLHVPFALRASRRPTVPVLVCGGGRVVAGSGAIARWCDGALPEPGRLHPAGPVGVEAAELERGFDDGLGPDARLWMYAATLPVVTTMAPFVLDGVPRWEQRVFRGGHRALDLAIRGRLGVTDANAAAALARVDACFDAVAARLADGRPYLCGDRFTAADLAFAALASPLLIPPQYGSPLPPLDLLPDAMVTTVRRLREHPAGAFALALYARERGVVVVPGPGA